MQSNEEMARMLRQERRGALTAGLMLFAAVLAYSGVVKTYNRDLLQRAECSTELQGESPRMTPGEAWKRCAR